MKNEDRIAIHGLAGIRHMLAQLHPRAHFAVHLAYLADQRRELKARAVKCAGSLQQPRGAEQPVHDVGHAPHGSSNACRAVLDLPGTGVISGLEQTLRVAVDDRQGRAKLV